MMNRQISLKSHSTIVPLIFISKIKMNHFGAKNNMAKTCDVWYPEQMKVK